MVWIVLSLCGQIGDNTNWFHAQERVILFCTATGIDHATIGIVLR
jgi:hypothetical protein